MFNLKGREKLIFSLKVLIELGQHILRMLIKM